MLNRLNIITRLALLLSFNILALSFDKVRNLVVLTLASLVIWALSRPNIDRVKFTLIVVVPTIWSFVLMQGMFYSAEPKTVLLVLVPPSTPVIGWLTGGIYIIYQGLIYGLVQSLRMVSVLLLGLAIAWSSSETEIFKTFIYYLRSIKITIATGIAIKFLDVFVNELRTLKTVLKIHSKYKFFRKLTQIVYVMSTQMIRKSYVVTLAVLSKGLTKVDTKRLERPPLTIVDKAIIVSTLVLASIIAILKILTILFLYGILYIPSLGYLYRWVLDNI